MTAALARACTRAHSRAPESARASFDRRQKTTDELSNPISCFLNYDHDGVEG